MPEAILDASLDYEETLRAVVQIAVPEVADWCAVSVLDDAGVLQEVSTAHVDDAQRELGRELSRRFPPDPDSASGTYGVARSGETAYVREVTDDMLVAGIPDPEHLALVRQLGLRSVVIAALKARGRLFGTLSLASAESGRRFEQADVQLAEELAARAGMAIDNARLYTERSRIAHTLQVKLLPERLPVIARTSMAARYRAAGELNEVGGDFYDVFQRSATEWALVVGDVSGKGAEAAAVTALARYTLRAAALEEGPPSGALRRLNTALLYDDTLAVRDRRHGLSLGRRRERARRAPRAGRSPGSRRPAPRRQRGDGGPLRHDGRHPRRHRRARRGPAPRARRRAAAVHRRRDRGGRPAARRSARRASSTCWPASPAGRRRTSSTRSSTPSSPRSPATRAMTSPCWRSA